MAKQWAEYAARMEPNAENHARYMECSGLYKQIYGHAKDDFVELARIRGKYQE